MLDPREGARSRVVLVEAPLGFGKTAYAEAVVAQRRGRVIRVRPDEGGGLPATLRRAFRRAGADLVDPGDSEGLTDPAAWADAAHVALAALAREDGGVHLLLLDAHRLDDRDTVAMAELVVDLPGDADACTAVVSGRDLGRWRAVAARPGVRVVRADDLARTPADIGADLGLPADHASVRELYEATQGWPAAVDLAVARLRRDPTWSPSGASGVRALLRDLMADVVSADPRVAVLAQLPLLDDRTLRLVAPGDPRRPDLPLRVSGRWWLVPAAVRDALGPRDPTGGPALAAEQVAAVAAHYHAAGETPAALDLLRAEHPAGVVPFLSRLRWDELEELDVDDLRAAVADLPAPLDTAAAALVLDAARAAELHDRPLRTSWLTRVLAEADDGATRRAAEAEHARDLLRGGDVEAGRDLARVVLDRLAPDEPATRARCLVTLGMGLVYECTPESLAEASQVFRDAAGCYRQTGDRRLLSDTLARLGYTTLYLAGHPAEGADVMSEALALLPTGDRVRAFWLTMYADVLEVLGRSEESDAAVREAVEIGDRRRDPMAAGMAWWTRSWTAALRGDVAGLRAALSEVERRRGPWLSGGQLAEFLGSSAEHLTLAGDVTGYHRYVGRADRVADEAGRPDVVVIPRAFFEAEHGDPVEALRWLDQMESMPAVVPVGAPRRLLLRAVALRRSGREAAATDALARALAAAADLGVPDLLHRQHPRQLAWVADLAPGVAAGSEPAARLRLLGGFALTVGDADRTPQPGHPATLVKLLALGAAPTTEVAIDLLWPDADVATGRARLRNTLNRLKERSGPVVRRTGDALALDEPIVVDAAAFERAAAAAFGSPSQERVGRARHAVALYAGDLLPGDLYADWAAAPRARLQRRYVSLLDLVAEDAVARGDLDEAAHLLDLGIAAEPLDEDRPLRLCRLLVDQRRLGTAREVAGRAVAALEELGVDPAPELVALAVE